MSAMSQELQRSYKGLKNTDKTPLYYMGYQTREVRSYEADALLGALRSELRRHWRVLDVDIRVGSRRFDNTHQIKGAEAEGYFGATASTDLTIDDDTAALRAQIWRRTDQVYKDALARYTKVKTNRDVTAEEEDSSYDFTVESAQTHRRSIVMPDIDSHLWRERIKRLSGAFKKYAFVYNSGVSLSVRAENSFSINSEGSEVATGGLFVRLGYQLSSRTEDGMDLERYNSYDAARLEDLPSEEIILRDMARSAEELQSLLKAPLTEPYTGPAIIRHRATGVYFHEILGHRLEGHRQKMEEEGQTFAKMLGKPVVADFISVIDDPTMERFGQQVLRGAYRFDDESVPSRPVTLIENGILKGFLLSRLPVRGFEKSNGHGRRSPGHIVAPRMGNLIVKPSRTVSYAELRRLLLEEIRRQKKPYGLIFDDIEGGFTATTRYEPQSFKVLPLLVYRVYADGRPDEPVRGVDIVGTPLTAFSKIIAAADDHDVFNGTCGAESGWVPVSAVAPSILVSEIEVEKKAKSSEKPPLLALPHHEGR